MVNANFMFPITIGRFSPGQSLMTLNDWIPRSKWFYIVSGTAASSGYYLWWDRHQSKVAQRLFEDEAYNRYGRQQVTPNDEPIKVTFIMAASDGVEMVERRRLFRQHVAKMFLKAGVDWQVVEVNETALAKKLNEARLADDDHKPVERVERGPLVTELASMWSTRDQRVSVDCDSNTKVLISPYILTPYKRAFLHGGLVALDPETADCLEKGTIRTSQQEPIKEEPKKTWWPFKKTVDAPQNTKLTVHTIDIPITHSMWSRLSRFVNKREETMKLCKESLQVIERIYNAQNAQ